MTSIGFAAEATLIAGGIIIADNRQISATTDDFIHASSGILNLSR
jgi:hypothetical protein